MNKKMIMLIDTETAGSLDNPLAYDYAMAIIDMHHNTYVKFRIIISNVFYGESEMMKSAYYANKLPQYYQAIANDEVLVMDAWEAKRFIREICEFYTVGVVAAHNARFDYKSTRNTAEAYTGTKNLVPYGLEWWDTLKMAHDTICKQKGYKQFCEENGFMTKHKTPRPQEKAETIYRFMTKDTEFVEAHTALEDVKIECEILWKCLDTHQKMRRKLWED